MPVVPQGNLNTTALVVPDLYVQIVPPQNLVLNGVPTNTIGIVGTASWGPVGQPSIIATMADYARTHGPLQGRKYDMGTQVATAVQQGAGDFRCVRVTDGTDQAASYAVFYANGAYPILLTARHTGSLGNQIALSIAQAPQPGSLRLVLGLTGQAPELFDVPAPTPQAFWTGLVAAVNGGINALRGPSQLCIASLGAATSTPLQTLAPQFLLHGSDGADGVTDSTLVGADGPPRRGMYALRGQGCSILVLADTDNPSTWTEQAGFAGAEGAYVMLSGPPGESIADAVAAKRGVGLDTPYAKLMFGDWVHWSDPVSGTIRIVSPQGFVAGRLANLSPEQSSLNKPLYAVIGTQRSGSPRANQATTYSAAELSALLFAGIDVIANPQPGGSFWGVRGGRNTSTNQATAGDNYTRMTHFIAATLAAGMGQYVGQVVNAALFRRIRATQLSFLQNLLGQGILGSIDGSQPFSVVCDASNNPPSRTALGYVQSDAQVQYQAINERFIVNMEGGQTVQVLRQTLPTGQVG